MLVHNAKLAIRLTSRMHAILVNVNECTMSPILLTAKRKYSASKIN